MKVLFLTNIPAPYRIDFFNELGKHCELTVWFEAQTEQNREWKVEGLGRHFRYKFLKGRTFGLDKHWNASIAAALGAEPFDVYVLGCYSSPTEIFAIHWLKLRRKPFILNSDGGFPGQDGLLQRKLKTYLISSASLWLSSGSNCTRYLKHYGAAPDRIREYPLAASPMTETERQPWSEEHKAAFKEKESLRGVVLLAVGQFIPRKGFDLLIRAYGRIRQRMPGTESSLLLVGGGPERSRYEETIRREGIAGVTLKPFMHKAELAAYWKAADVFVLPTRYDVWGLVVNEAAAFGLPIVTTSMAGAAYDLVQDGGNGFVAEPNDVESLADCCERLVADAALRETFGRRSLELAEQYAMERMVSRHLDILEEWKAEGGKPGREHLHVDL